MEKKFITQDDALGFLEDWMNIPAESRMPGRRIIISDSADGTLELGLCDGSGPMRSMTVIPDDMSMTAKAAMKYLIENGDNE